MTATTPTSSKTSQEYLINWLKNPNNYPHTTQEVKTLETHISTVFLTGDYAYKLKKPVDYGFLNFTQLADRKKFTQLELELNKRTAPEIYLQVIPIYQSPENLTEFSFNKENTSWKPADYLVQMRQFNPDEVLSRKLINSQLTPTQRTQLAQTIAQLHLEAEILAPNSELGTPEAVIAPMLDNFTSLIQITDKLTNPANQLNELKNRLNRLKLWTENQAILFAPALEDRRDKQQFRACHGDLHLDNITLINDQPILFDGIEFNEAFRWIDTLNDLAFLLTDLDFRQLNNLALNLLNEYLKITGDYKGLLILRFYQTYRALVRAKITGLRYLQLNAKTQEAELTWQSLLDYISLAEDYAFNSNTTPTLYLMQGVSGTGKSTLARELAEKTGALHLSSDLERKRIYGISPTTRLSPEEKKNLYSYEMSGKTHDRLYQIAATSLQSGFSIILDATFLQAKYRQRFLELAELYHANYLIIALEPNKNLAKQWLLEREKRNTDASDANYQVMQHQLEVYEPPLPTENSITLTMRQKLPEISQLNQLAGGL